MDENINEEFSEDTGETGIEENAEDETEEVVDDTEETTEGTIYIDNLVDYSNYFENLQTIGIFICALLVAQGICLAFFKGLRR